jgi:2-oxoglutarate dehydrogenase E2 component (dihydrolipoamide succinyltransferase)
MILEMKVPSPGESITEVEIAQWLVSDGDYVEKDQAIAEVDSDKATLELPAEISGTITLKAEEGDAVEVGAVVCLIDSEGNASASKIKDKTTDNIKAESAEIAVQTPVVESSYAAQSPSPAAKKIMNEKGISINEVKGSGRGGRITKNDAVKAVPSMGTPPDWGERNQNRSKLSMLRRKVAERLVDAKNETAMLTTFNEVDMAEVFKVRNAFKDEFLKKHKAKLGFMSFFYQSCCSCFKALS